MPDLNSRVNTHYDLLGVRPTASPQQIRQAFRELSKLYHPDTTSLPADQATEKFQQINEAYAILSSPERRWTYDQQVGYSRISVMQPMESVSRASTVPQRKAASNIYLNPTDRPLSAGEIFALFILGLTFVACLALVVTVSLTRSDYVAESAQPGVPELTELARPDSDPPSAEEYSQPEAAPSSAAVAPTLPAQPQPSRSYNSGSMAPQPPRWL